MLGLWVSAFVCALPPCAFSGNLIRKKVKRKKKEEVKLPGNLIWTHEFTYHLRNIWELVSAVFWAGVQQWFSLVLWLLNSVKNLPAVQETQVQSMGWEDALEKGMATHPSTLAWRIPWMEKPGRLQSMGSHRVGHDWSDLAGSFNYNLTVFCCGYLLCLWQWVFQGSYLGILKTLGGFHMPIQIGISFCMLIWESTLQCIY